MSQYLQHKVKTEPVFLSVLAHCLLRSLRVGLTVSVVLSFLILLFANLARAEENNQPRAEGGQIIEKPGQMRSGGLLFKAANQYTRAALLHTDVQIVISGMISRTKVKQTFFNSGETWQEGIYVFPLPETAAVDHLRMHIGERIIEGQIKEKREAKKHYQAARRAGKKASLLEQERANIFTSSLANIGPGEHITVEIEYQQRVHYERGRFSLRFPMVVAPRYIAGNTVIKGFSGSGWAYNTNEVNDAARITPPPMPATGKSINPVSISIELDAGFAIESITSAYHDIVVKNLHAPGQYRIELKEKPIPANRDFELSWNITGSALPQAALFTERLNGHDYALVMLAPPYQQQDLILKREIVFVIDTSGSMAGTSIVQAKAALQLALARLRTGERFNIIQFNSHTSQLFQYPRAVSPDTIQQAQNYLSELHANGGTEMAAAIRAALTNQNNSLDIRQVVFLTDGSVGNENALFQQIKNLLGSSRLFTIGIGSAPNSHFMNRAARFGRGTHTYIGDVSEVQLKMNTLFSKLENPVLSNISVDTAGLQDVEVWPQQIPDLYLGEPLLLSLKAKRFPGSIRIKGQLRESVWQTELALEGGQERAGVSGLWARRKIAALMELNTRAEEHKVLRQQILDTALEHHLVSKYTSLLAVDVTPARTSGEPLQKTAVPVSLPAGWQHNKVFKSMPQTATPATLYLILGFLTLLVGTLLRRVFLNV